MVRANTEEKTLTRAEIIVGTVSADAEFVFPLLRIYNNIPGIVPTIPGINGNSFRSGKSYPDSAKNKID